MPFDLQNAKTCLQSFDLQKLFIQSMGWDHADLNLELSYNGEKLRLAAVAQKRGLMAFLCSPQADGQIPGYAGRRKIETQLRKSVHEHILIFTNSDRSRQVWQWVRREPGRPTTSREFEFSSGQSGDALLNHLQAMAFSMDEEEELGIVDVTSRVRAAFDVERVTRRFYERFKNEHDALLGFLQGIPDEEMQRWYVSVTMNRLMFVYFIQKKNFLNNDPDYLRNRLLESRFRAPDRFYADFLCPLFFEGFAKKEAERDPQINRLLGKVPYLNGGIFQKHQIEQMYGNAIRIPDQAFERVFDFFDQYRWHLDERPLRNDSEINPDVLGYIFEKYINQREMGAYYTKEDITGYISKSTVLPYLLDQARKDCAIAFQGEHSVWQLLQADPERYIYDAVKKGCDLPLPAEIAAGIGDVSKRGEWNKSAAEEFALPTETWREAAARRERFAEVRGKLARGEVQAVDDLITYNLDIQQFTQDVVEESEGPELLRAFWKGLRGVKVLDPTCGSGAFLFAALNQLEPLYEACLERMQAFVAELDASAEKHRPEKFADFRQTLAEVQQHPNRRYFILKSIIVNNLYGVDIMEEAVEICKLRLFLKLIAQVERAEQVEPLPDIDFNIRSGNTLVGFTSLEDVRQAMMTVGEQIRILYPEEEAQLKRIDEGAELASRAFEQFQQQQLVAGFVRAEDKAALRERLEKLNEELNRALARSYGVDPDSLEYAPWLEKYKPFHWYVEFFGIMAQGGFDIIIGNPPYVEYRTIVNTYRIRSYLTKTSGNLYSFVVERNLKLTDSRSRSGMIIPHSAFCTDRMSPLMSLLEPYTYWLSTYDIRPSKLFNGVDQRLSIYLLKITQDSIHYSTKYNRWIEEFRSMLFNCLEYQKLETISFLNSIPKIQKACEISIWKKISNRKKLSQYLSGQYQIYYHNAPRYWIRAMSFAPYFWNERNGEQISTQVKTIQIRNPLYASSTISLLNSSLFYWWFIILSDCRHLNMREIENFPVDLDVMTLEMKNELSDLANQLMENYRLHSHRKEAFYQATGKVKYDEFFPSYSKPIINQIDKVLACYYEFTDEELDFIINYDIKYRMGAEE